MKKPTLKQRLALWFFKKTKANFVFENEHVFGDYKWYEEISDQRDKPKPKKGDT